MEKELLLKYLNCETSQEEEILLSEWLDTNPENQKELDRMQLIMENIILCTPEIKNIDSSKSTSTRRIKLLTTLSKVSIAALIAVIVTAGIGYKHFLNILDELSNKKTIIEIPNGQRLSITLSDGTEVCLNSGTKLEYPSVFSSKERRVRISGEAMFEVKNDVQRPFIVETFACDIEVLGTKFNIEAYESDNIFSTALIKGSIKLTNNILKSDPIIMKPNDRIQLAGNNLQLKKIENNDEYLWTEGIISISNASFKELITKFERIYNVKIDIRSKNVPIINYNRGKIRASDGIDHALKVLQSVSGFSYMKDKETGKITIL